MSRVPRMGTTMAMDISATLPPGFRLPGRRVIWRMLQAAFLVASLASSVANADSTLTIAPRISVTETYSSNRTMTGTASDDGWVTNLAPGISINSSGARLKGYLDYQLNGYYYLGESNFRDSQHQLNSLVTLEAIDNWLYFDASASIFQRQQSLFGPVAVTSGTGIDDQSESRVAQVSPYIRGRIPSLADYLVRVNVVESRSDLPAVANTRVNQAVGTLGNQAITGGLGWVAEANITHVSNDVIGARDDERVRFGLVIPVSAQVHLSLFEGRERTDYLGDERETFTTPGIGLQWAPNTRTQFAGVRERRFFGMGHSYQLSHRTRLLALRYSDVKDASVLPSVPTGVYRGSIYNLMSDLLVSSVPDPDERAVAARARVDQIGSGGSLAESGGATTSRLFVDRTRQVSAAIVGTRNTLTLIVQRRDEEVLGVAIPGIVDDFTLATDIRERGATLSWLHRLSPTRDFRLASSKLSRDDYGVSDLRLEETTNSAFVVVRLGPRAAATFGVFRTRAVSSLRGRISEDAAAASLTHQF